MHRIEILIIDDDHDDFLIVQSLLEDIAKAPLRLEWASSYSEGERLLAENRHAICLMDYKLGAKDGIELLNNAPSLGFTGPIILMTGMHQVNVDMLALEAGAADYLVKNGLTAEQLARSIRYALGRREMEIERVERLRAEAENRSKSEFLAHLSHELRTPLSAILGFTELLINSSQSEENLSHLNIVHRNGKHLLGLLNDILDLSKIEAGKLDLEIQPLKLMPFLADVYSLMYTAAMDKNLHLNVSGTGPLPETIYTDPMRLRQVLLNLIGNAIKFTHEGFVNILVSMVRNNDKPLIEFQVQDSGLGISTADINAIFKPFVQIKHFRAQTRTGSGLGLTISQQLVQHLGGDIQVTSQENLGSCFSFTIDPGNLANVPHRALSLQMDTEKPTLIPITQFSGRILVVDDLRDIRALVGHYLRRCGLQVDYATDGQDAINKIQQAASLNNAFDVIFMDIHMPVKDGITAAREIRSLNYSCPLIALTAAHMKGDQDLYLECGFNASLSKPIDQAQLMHLLNTFLDRTGAEALENHQPAQAASADGTADTSVRGAPAIQHPDRNILVVEDAPDALAAIGQLLEIIGWNPIMASDARTALDLAKHVHPTHALVDINLPDADGYSLSRDLQSLLPDIRIFISSGADFDPSKACPAIRGHLLKPISLDQLQRFLPAGAT